jgi:NitT/TauT family transport system substrate-binding protein
MGKTLAKIGLLVARARLVMLQVVFTDLIIGLIFVCSSISLAAGGEPTEFSVGISGNGVTIFSLWMAQAGGFYKKEGLNVEVIDMEGSTRGIQVLLSGKIHLMHAGLGPVLQANRQGADLRIVAATSNSIPFTFFAASEVKTGADLKGGIVAIGTFGSEGDIAVTLALKQLGLSRRDVIIVQVGEFSKRFTALISGQVKATPLVEPASTIARDRGFNPLVDLAAAKIPWVFTGITVNRSSLKNHRDLLARFIRAEIEGAYFALANPTRSKEVIALKFKTNDPKAIEATYNDFKRIIQLDFEPSQAGAENVVRQLEAIGINVGSKNMEDHIDNSIIQSLKKEGFFTSMKQRYNVQ